MKVGWALIAEERQNQISTSGYSFKHDDEVNNHYQLSMAASLLCYLDPEEVSGSPIKGSEFYDFSHCCPPDWNEKKWNKMMNKSYEERLIIAGALIAAEIDRLLRSEEKK